jgi:hypothetical protein
MDTGELCLKISALSVIKSNLVSYKYKSYTILYHNHTLNFQLLSYGGGVVVMYAF